MKVWCERNFSLLPPELHRACLTAVTETMVSLSLPELAAVIIHIIAQVSSSCGLFLFFCLFFFTGRKFEHDLIKDDLY